MPLAHAANFDERTRLARALPIGVILTILLVASLRLQEAFLIGYLAAIGQDQVIFLRESLHLDASKTRSLFSHGLIRMALLVKLSVIFTFISVGWLTLCVNDLKHTQTALPFALRTLVYFACLFAAWLQMHNSFAMLYAKLYFSLNPVPAADGTDPQGFIFAGSDEPIFSDFLYVSYAVALTYAMSDTNLEDSNVRRIVLLHSLVSFLFLSIVLTELIHLLGSL
ncbi:MAG: DUF1345 domain-containing protein [Cyanobacteriota bacterium]|nr:DUF1345 domain-containing protein [Cyanobacteriota bacterium]